MLTTLTKEALPVLRYRTGDITRLYEAPCDCGRTCRRMDNVTGRTDDLLIVRGVNVYASQIEDTVVGMDGVSPHYRIDLRREDNLDRMQVTVEHTPEYEGTTDGLAERVETRLKEVLAVTPDEVTVLGPGGVDRNETGKVQRVYDHRD